MSGTIGLGFHDSEDGVRLLASSSDRLEQVRIAYEECHVQYLESTPSHVTGAMKTWMDRTVQGVSLDARILEIGSGSGRDADYFESLGFRVQRTDVARPFVERLQRLGHDAAYLDAVRDSFPEDLDVIFANAVVCHFEQPQFSQFLMRARDALKPRAILSFTTKYADEYESTAKQRRLPQMRKFSRWPTDQLIAFLAEHDFTVDWHTVTGGIRSSSQWINVVASRQPAIYEA